MLSTRKLLFCVFSLLLASSCGLEERKNKARANSVRGFISGTVGYFNSEASVICAEVAEAKTEVVPPLDKVCSKGCSCASSAPGDADPKTVYDCDLWRAREWKMLRFMGKYTLDEKIKPVVYFHHQARWRRTELGCRPRFYCVWRSRLRWRLFHVHSHERNDTQRCPWGVAGADCYRGGNPARRRAEFLPVSAGPVVEVIRPCRHSVIDLRPPSSVLRPSSFVLRPSTRFPCCAARVAGLRGARASASDRKFIPGGRCRGA